MNIKKNIKINNTKLKLYTSTKAFKPTATTDFLLRDALTVIKKPMDVLDLGCGIGIIGIMVSKHIKNKRKIYASDVSDGAKIIAEKNFKLHKCDSDVRVGSLLTPWRKQKFDLIINDVSGISETIAKKSKWFKNVPCKSGTDGTKLTLKIISSSINHLNKNGAIIFPIISLSNGNKVIKKLKNKFSKIKILSENFWFLPDDLEKYKKKLTEMKKSKLIDYDIKFGKVICSTKIVYAKI
jgi:ribosomal protein L11 methylase PrmA